MTPVPARRLSIRDLQSAPGDANRKKLYTYSKDNDLIAPLSGGVNLVLSREIRRNAMIAAEMAVGIAKENPAKRVVYVNSYASPGLMKTAFSAAVAKHSVPASEPLDNLCLLEIRIDQWDKESLRYAINGWDEEGKMKEDGREATVIMNSFEYAALNRNKRPRIVRDLLQLQEEYDLGVIVFTHELRKDLLPGMPSRGAIGFMATKAVSVFEISDPFAKLQRHSQIFNNRSESSAEVHEREMRGAGHNILTSEDIPIESNGETRSYSIVEYLSMRPKADDPQKWVDNGRPLGAR